MTPNPSDDLARRAAATPSATALVWDEGSLTYRDLDERATAMAGRLRECDAAAGDTVTLCATPGAETVTALFGLWRAGCVAVPLHERLTPSEVDRARRIVMSTLQIDNQTLHYLSHSNATTQLRPARPLPNRLGSFPNIVACILTSGSSGAPKALGFTRDAFAASASAVASRLDLTATDRWGLCLSPGHIGGLSLVVRAAMTGASVRLWPSFDPGAVARAVVDGQVTHLAVVPVMLRRVLSRLAGERVPATLRCVLVGGAAASRSLLDEAWAAGVPVATTWGMTETASQVATAPPDLARRHPGTAGRPLRGLEVRVAADAPGTLEVRGPTLATVAIRGPGAHPEPLATDPDGWFATRDLGRIDPDGLVWIDGRADAIIVSGGLNVSPGEVERVIETMPGVTAAVVFGVPDEEWGEVVAAVVEGDPAVVDAEAVDRHCRTRLARGRCPSRIVVVDSLSRTWTGKVMRSRVSERYGRELRVPRPAAAGSGPGSGGEAGGNAHARRTT
ncbi:MAG: AMP-binding protein [Gemmatimonadota bacterium]|nr:AMP-binding protein [Gemmatimonadota bacterium]MDE2864924.1 AMP-binding protein [Gemmatimonadota bacterium]